MRVDYELWFSLSTLPFSLRYCHWTANELNEWTLWVIHHNSYPICPNHTPKTTPHGAHWSKNTARDKVHQESLRLQTRIPPFSDNVRPEIFIPFFSFEKRDQKLKCCWFEYRFRGEKYYATNLTKVRARLLILGI